MSEKKIWKIDGYTSATHARRAAELRGETGDPGQVGGVRCLNNWHECRGWVFCTRDGRFLIPDGEVPKEVMQEVYKKQ